MSQSRREFLKSAVGTPALLSLGGAVPTFLTRAAGAAKGKNRADRVLVVVQLSGGNDGLNTVVPYADDIYGRKRSTLRLRGKDVLKIDDYVGFHPKMEGFSQLLKAGQLGIVQGIGCPGSDRSHPGAMRDWHTAQPNTPQCPTGWIGRAIDCASHKDPARTQGIFVGPIAQPFALAAQNTIVPSIRSARQLTLRREVAAINRPAGDNPLADHVHNAARGAHVTNRQIQAVLANASRAGNYPRRGLGPHLKTVAELIAADVGIRIFFTELGGGGIGGFDNHANQRDNHASLLGHLSTALTAFAADLSARKCFDRVTLMTFSEFGRTLTENGRRGTGHGNAAPVFLMGSKVRAGLIGKHPPLTDLDNDAPRFHTDFRRLYATVLTGWLGMDSKPVLGADFKPLDLFT
ncbi:MAG: DUF1501 domain-containing protein [Phycisphaerae bacterium]|jgi:uncharacterized protein (DUF1501 family)|nr:DUF1501 domain-containing protein [Phycisphaerae bacterium]